jgi:hypothetical protein
MLQHFGKYLIIIGAVITAAGVLLILRDSLPFLKYIGKLPGDIYIKKENFTFYFPLMTGIIISILLSLILFILNRIK